MDATPLTQLISIALDAAKVRDSLRPTFTARAEAWLQKSLERSPNLDSGVRLQRLVQAMRDALCPQCSGTGVFRWAGHFENGTWRGKEGTCYHCEGKGAPNAADDKRNEAYWNLYAKIEA